MLIANDLYKKYLIKERKSFFSKATIREVNAVNGVSLKVERGKIVGLLGVNGAGKTTTIKMLCSIIEPTSGQITIDNIDMIKEHKKVKEYINLITGGERNLYWRLTAKENLEYFGALYGISKRLLDQRIDYLLDIVGLANAKDTAVERYSKGMKQRLQIARGLINDPSYLFLDEPTLGLDISVSKELRKYIKNLASVEKKGVLLTTHYIKEAEELCDYIYIIDKGTIIEQGTIEDLKKKLKGKFEISITLDSLTDDICEKLKCFIIDENVEAEISDKDKNIIKVSSTNNCTNRIIQYFNMIGISIMEIKMLEPDLGDILLNQIYGGETFEKNYKYSMGRNTETAS